MALIVGGVAVDATAAEIDVLDGLDRGSIIYGNASSATTVLGQGGADEVLTSNGTDLAWAAAAGGVDGITSTADATAITIDSSENVKLHGNVAIGVTPPAFVGGVGAAQCWLQLGGNNFWGGGHLWASHQMGYNPEFNVSYNVKRQDSDDDDTYITSSSHALVYKQHNGEHIFKVAPAGTANTGITWTTAMTIDNTGDVDIATSLGVGTAASSTTGEIRALNDITAYYSSDVRLKKNIKPIDNALLRLDKINGYEFDWKKGRPKNIHSHEGHAIGVSAQEIMEVLPEVVQKRDNGYLAVDYQKIVALLINGIKELKAEIEEIKDGYRK